MLLIEILAGGPMYFPNLAITILGSAVGCAAVVSSLALYGKHMKERNVSMKSETLQVLACYGLTFAFLLFGVLAFVLMIFACTIGVGWYLADTTLNHFLGGR